MNAFAHSARSVTLALAGCLLLGACSGGGDDLAAPELAAPVTASTPTGADADETASGGTTAATEMSTETLGAASATLVPSETLVVTLPPTATPVSVVEVAEVGVPGLDSDDVFCASWSRFAGSFQVVAVTAAFGSGSPEQLSALEVAAAPTVTSAYDQLVANWPDELSSEADLVADEFLGPFARRLETASEALRDTGADDATISAIADAWLAGLAQRDPTTPEFVVDLPDEIWAVIDEAAAGFGAQRVPFASDPSLVTNVQTPLTSEYLAISCPDQGALSGQEVETP